MRFEKNVTMSILIHSVVSDFFGFLKRELLYPVNVCLLYLYQSSIFFVIKPSIDLVIVFFVSVMGRVHSNKMSLIHVFSSIQWIFVKS